MRHSYLTLHLSSLKYMPVFGFLDDRGIASFCMVLCFLQRKSNEKRRTSSRGRQRQNVWNLWPRCLSQSERTTSLGVMTDTGDSPINPRPPLFHLRSQLPSSRWFRLSLQRRRSRPFRSRRQSQRRRRHSTAPRNSITLPLPQSSRSTCSNSRPLLTCCAPPR